MKKVLSTSLLSFLLFGTLSLINNYENKKFEVRDLLAETFTNEATGRKVKVKKANEVTASVSESLKVQQRYDAETGTYDFRFVAGINTVDVDKAKITITLNGKTASKDLTNAYTHIVVNENELAAADVFGEGYDYLLAYVLSDVPYSAVSANFDVAIDLVSNEESVASADRNVTFSDIIDLDFEPSIEFTTNEDLKVVAGSAVALPSYTLVNSVDTACEVVVTSSGEGTVADGKYTPHKFAEAGTHRLTYTAVNTHTGAEKVLGYKDVTVAEKVLAGATNYNDIVVNDAFNNPYLTNTDKGCSGLSFNFDASKNYYVEFNMNVTSYLNNVVIGFSHNESENGYPTSGAYYNGIKMNSGSYELAHGRYQKSWSIHDTRMWMATSYANRKNTKALSLIGTNKVAIARDGDRFYTFFNDQVYNVAVYPELQNKDTYPGILFAGDDTNTLPVSFSDFKFVRSAEDVTAKVNALTNGTTFDHYTRWGNTLANDFLDFDVTNGVRFSDRGKNNDSFNDNMASPYVHLYGNWTVEFDYKLGNTNWAALHIDIRTVWDNFSVMDNRFVSWTNNFGENSISTEIGSLSKTSILDSFKALTHRNNIHFTISCVVGSNKETYTIVMNDGVVTKTEVIDANYTNTGRSYTCGSAKYFIFKSQKWIGTISNFDYRTEAK